MRMRKYAAFSAEMPPLKKMELIHEFVRGYSRGGKVYRDANGDFWFVNGIMSHRASRDVGLSLMRENEKKRKEEPLTDSISK